MHAFLVMLTAAAAAAPLPSKLIIRTPKLTATMEAASSWTIRSLRYDGVPIIKPAGGQGAVLLTRDGKWVGSAMSRKITEPVETFMLSSGELGPTQAGAAAVVGDRVVVRKRSRLGGFLHEAETVFEADRFVQHHTFEAVEDLAPRTFYAFLYSFTTAAREWAAQPLRGKLRRGTFKQTGGHAPDVPCAWLAQYDPKTGKGALIYFQTPFYGRGASTQFWDAKSYHKLLARPLRGEIRKGTKLDYTIVVQCFAAPADQWVARAQEAVKKLEQEFPMTKPPALPPEKKLYGEGVPETGDLTLETRHYSVRFEARPAWTIRNIDYDGQTVASPTGWYGTVLVPKGGRWWGTGHTEGGREIVRSLKLLVDGKPHLFGPGAVVKGHALTLVKDSVIWKFDAREEVTVADDYILERTRLTAREDADVKLMYYYMHCIIPSTTKWAAELPDGSFETGPLDHKKGFSINKDVRWAAQFEPNLKLSILCYMPKVVSGPRSMSKIWNQPRYHKYYVQQNQGQSFKKGDTLDYTLIFQVVPGETGDWTRTKAAAEKLKEKWPPVQE